MNRIIFVLLFLMAFISAQSQVDTIADNIYENNGKLGIGTTSPNSKLEVNGMIHSTNEGFKFPDGTIQTTATVSGSNINLLAPSRIHIGDTSLFPSAADGPFKIVSYNQSYGAILLKNPQSNKGTGLDFYNDKNLRFVVGIGGSERPYALEKNCAFLLTSNQDSNEEIEGLVIGHRFSSAPIIFAQNNTEVLRISENGNIGIGTQFPNSKLEVDGTIHSAFGGYKFPDGTIQITAATSPTSYWNSLNSGEIFTTNKVGIDRTNFQSYFLYTKFWVHDGWLQVSDSTDHDAGLVICHLKKSGYGFARSLHQVYSGVEGDPYTEFRVRNNNDEITDQSWAIGIDNSDGNKLKITSRTNNPTGASPSYGDNKMTITPEGNVGINTNDPRAKVEIADGDIFISDIYRGIIMKSPDGNCWRGTLDNTGNLIFSLIDCPGEININFETNSLHETKTLSIFPNPIDNTVTINSQKESLKNTTAIIYSVDGKIVRKNELSDDYYILNVTNIPSGSYIISVVNKKGKELGHELLVKE